MLNNRPRLQGCQLDTFTTANRNCTKAVAHRIKDDVRKVSKALHARPMKLITASDTSGDQSSTDFGSQHLPPKGKHNSNNENESYYNNNNRGNKQ